MHGFCPLASGSKGNCTLVASENSKILIDAGLSGKATVSKLAELGIDISEIDAILITHEHTDHIRGLNTLAFKYGIPVFANADTAKSIIHILNDKPSFKIFTTGETFEHKDLVIHPFSVQHDTVDPVMFTIKFDGIKLGFCTDLGFVTSLVRSSLMECDYLLLESNHDEALVHSCSRPMVYKQRVLGRSGHLSNSHCAKLISEVAHSGLKRVYLAHLSGECNTPETALSTVKTHLQSENILLDIHIAYQDKVSLPTYFKEYAAN